MEEFGTDIPRDDIYSKSVRAGKRTYFFDVKSTRSNELYLTITESKRRFNQQTGKFFYEKHKLFLYREDFDKFKDALVETFDAIERLQGDIIVKDDYGARPLSVQKEESDAEPGSATTDPDQKNSTEKEDNDHE